MSTPSSSWAWISSAWLRIHRQLLGHQLGQVRVDAPVDVDLGQLGELGLRVALQLAPLDLHLGLHRLVLAAHRDVLAAAHRERPGQQARHPGDHHRTGAGGGRGDAGDQAEVGDQAVDHAEHGRTQPAAGDLAVLVADREVGVTDRVMRRLHRGRYRAAPVSHPRAPGAGLGQGCWTWSESMAAPAGWRAAAPCGPSAPSGAAEARLASVRHAREGPSRGVLRSGVVRTESAVRRLPGTATLRGVPRLRRNHASAARNTRIDTQLFTRSPGIRLAWSSRSSLDEEPAEGVAHHVQRQHLPAAEQPAAVEHQQQRRPPAGSTASRTGRSGGSSPAPRCGRRRPGWPCR